MGLRTDIEGFVLAGGESRRFGSDKARARIDGMALVEHNVAALAERFQRVRVVSAPGRSYADLGLETVYDLQPDVGPLGGIQAALLHAATERVAIAACDLVGLQPGWYALLQAINAPAVAFRDERWHPLVAIYGRTLLPEIAARIDAGKLAVRDMLDACAVAVEPPAGFVALHSVDTPELLP